MIRRSKVKDAPPKVDCLKCAYNSGKSENHLTDCSHVERNPRGAKVGTWLKECRYYTERK